MERATERGTPAGRPLFAANRELPPRDDVVERFWQACTTIREHRGDGHVAMLTAAGLDGCEAHVLFAAERGTPVGLLLDNRGWTDDDWAAAGERLAGRGLIAANGEITGDGCRVRAEVEAGTDRLATAPFDDLGAVGRQRLLDDLDTVARVVVESGLLPYPNPMGLPKLGD